MKKISVLFLYFMVCGIQINSVFADGNTKASPCYESFVDYDNPDFSPDRWLYGVTFQNGEELRLYDDNIRHTFLIINGSFENAYVKIKGGISLVSAEFLCSKLGFELNKQNDVEIIISQNSKSISLTAESSIVQTDGIYEEMPHKAEITDGEFFVPLRYICETFGAKVTYSDHNIAPFYNYVIDVDNREKTVSMEEALEKAKTQLLKNYWLLHSDSFADKQVLEEIYESIENISYADETAGFWLIDGTYLLLVDKTTGDLYVKYGNGQRGYGSYSESIVKADDAGESFFDKDYFYG